MSVRGGLRIDVRDLLRRARRWINTRVAGAEINAGFVSFPLVVNDPERTSARELVIRLRDKRVFTAGDCCDGCVKNSMASLQDVRKVLVDVQVQLANLHDGQLFWLVDYMLVTVKAFLTWEERARLGHPRGRDPDEHYRDYDKTKQYIMQLDVVRAHFKTALGALGAVAAMDLEQLQGAASKEALALAAEPKYLLMEPEE